MLVTNLHQREVGQQMSPHLFKHSGQRSSWGWRAGEMVQHLRTLAAHAEDPGLVPSTHSHADLMPSGFKLTQALTFGAKKKGI